MKVNTNEVVHILSRSILNYTLVLEEQDLEKLSNTKHEQKAKQLYDKKKAEISKGRRNINFLIGNKELLMSKVIESLKSTLADAEMHYRTLDLEYKEISAEDLTREFVNSIQPPKGKDGGIVIIDDIESFFRNNEDINTQIYILSRIMMNPFGCDSTGWSLIVTTDEDIYTSPIYKKTCLSYFENEGEIFYYEINE